MEGKCARSTMLCAIVTVLTWQGVLAQVAALAFVLGSYVAAESVRKRRRARILAAPIATREPAEAVGHPVRTS